MEKSLYERLGGAFAIAAVVDHFSDAVVKNPIVGQRSENPAFREWHTNNLGRLPGLKFMRTLWVCNVAGGPFQYSATKPGSTALGLEEAHRKLKISPAQFDEVAAEPDERLPKVPDREERGSGCCRTRDEVTGNIWPPPAKRPDANAERAWSI
jgi:hemoglobin